MTFDKNQSSFTSEFCRAVWWWAVGIVPPEVSLTDEVIAKCTPDVLQEWEVYRTKIFTKL